jgi:hypothetical protein
MKKASLVLVAILVIAFSVSVGYKQSARADPNTNSIRGQWLLEEDAGTTASDSSGNHNDGTIVGGATWTAGHLGTDYALDFDGSSGYVDIPDSNSLKVTSNLKIDVWIYPHTVGTKAQTIVFKGNSIISPSQNAYYLALGRDGVSATYSKVCFSISHDGFTNIPYLFSASTISANTWTHVVATYDGTYMTIYIGGVQDNATLNSGAVFVGSDQKYARIGAFMPLEPIKGVLYPRYFDGIIDEVQISSDTLLYTSPNIVSKTESDVGHTFDLSIMATGVTNLCGFDIKITWDNTLMGFVSSDKSGLDTVWPGGEGTGWYLSAEENGVGYYDFAAACLAPTPGYTGTNELFKVTFLVKEPSANSKQASIAFAIHKLVTIVDTLPAPIAHVSYDGLYRIKGVPPTIKLNPTPNPPECTKIGDQIQIAFSIENAVDVMGFNFTVCFNTTLLDFTSVIFDAVWTAKTSNANEAGGQVYCSGNATGQSGTVQLVTIKFTANCPKIWRDEHSIEGSHNDQPGTIYIQTAHLRYDGNPTLRYTKDDPSSNINVDPEVTYTFKPIKGDIANNDGKIDLYDLVTICERYGVTPTHAVGLYNWGNSEPYDLITIDNEQIIDIFDVIIISSTYTG